MAAAAAFLGSRTVDDSPSTPAPDALGLIPFEDKRRDISISVPAGWRRVPSDDPEVVLVAGTPEASLLVRATKIPARIEPRDLRRAKNLTDRLVARGERVRLLRPARQIELGGLPGWLYIYSFADRDTGQRGAHAHYFLFRGDTMITVVFQTVPSEAFATYAPLFDRLEASFRAGTTDTDSS